MTLAAAMWQEFIFLPQYYAIKRNRLLEEVMPMIYIRKEDAMGDTIL